MLNMIGASTLVAQVWVPSNKSVDGNEIADMLSKQNCHISWAARVPLPLCFGKEYFFSKISENCKNQLTPAVLQGKYGLGLMLKHKIILFL